MVGMQVMRITNLYSVALGTDSAQSRAQRSELLAMLLHDILQRQYLQ